MSFLAPVAFTLTLLLPVIVAMYLLRLRRTEREVSSIYLWRRMVRDVEANAPWQRLRRNLLLILQLLFLLALILALARPFTWAEGSSGEAAIIILDTSASMAATDVAPTRLEAAKERARQIVSELPDEARVTVIAAGERAEVLVASSQDRRQAYLAIKSVQPTSGGSDLGVALELASAIAARQPETEIVVLSDGRAALPVGLNGENQAISLLTLERAPGGEGLTAFAQVSNYGEADAQRRLSLLADGQLINVYDLQIPAGGQQAVVAEGLPAETELLMAQLERVDDVTDILPTDDQAQAVQRTPEPVNVQLVTTGNLFLETALDILPGVQVTKVDPEGASQLNPSDLTIFDNHVPVTMTLPAGSLLFIAPVRSTEYFTTTGTVEGPTLRAVDLSDPLLKHVSLAGVSVLDAVRLPLPDWARPVIAGDLEDGGSVPLLMAGQVDGRRVGVLAFDLRRSDLPLQLAFPILWANLIDWLAPGRGGDVPAQMAPGAVLSLPAAPEVEKFSVRYPDGTTRQFPVEEGRMVFSETDQLGLYRLNWGENEEVPFVVNLFLPQESDLDPADQLPGLTGMEAEAGAEALRSRREWWRPLALLAVLLLTVEWIVYQRAALARLKNDLMGLSGRLRPARG